MYSEHKVYIEIVKQLREMIFREQLKPGDKLPSERELSERLMVGRSSVREALRALELLGLIETKRGEGTFIRDFRGHHLVQLLSTFILHDQAAKRDVQDTKFLIELDSLFLAMNKQGPKAFAELKKWVESSQFNDDEFFFKMIMLSDNHLLFRIWTILNDYYHSLELTRQIFTKQEYLTLIDTLNSKDEGKVRRAYEDFRKLSYNG
nr:GntR family transcriptional regulator [uncultured Bacillus sp.]